MKDKEFERLLRTARELKSADDLQAQRESWVIGELMLEHPGMTREEAEQLYLRAIAARSPY